MLKRLAIPIYITAAVPGCREDRPAVPPPVADGKCLVAHWVGALATDQTCQLGGYSWHCLADPAKGLRDQTCDRGPELGEAPARGQQAAAK